MIVVVALIDNSFLRFALALATLVILRWKRCCVLEGKGDPGVDCLGLLSWPEGICVSSTILAKQINDMTTIVMMNKTASKSRQCLFDVDMRKYPVKAPQLLDLCVCLPRLKTPRASKSEELFTQLKRIRYAL